MEKILTSNSNFYILVDNFPYKDSISKLETEFASWFDFKTKQKKDISNYDLNSNSSNSLISSFNTKLKTGNFTFLYYNDICLCFCGLQVEDKNAWIHRLFTNPLEYIKHLGTISQYILPYQISCAKNMNCKYYKLTYHGNNQKFYYFYKNQKYYKSKFYKNNTLSGVENISKFDFIGEEIINNTAQLVARLDLSIPDIDQFCKF